MLGRRPMVWPVRIFVVLYKVQRASARIPIPLRRKLLYSFVMTAFLAAAIECSFRIATRVSSNYPWRYHANLMVSIGFEGLNDILEPDPDRFWRLRRNVNKRCEGEIGNSGPLSFNVSTDEYGFRRTANNSDAGHTILFLGDSCTFGVGVDDQETFVSLLQNRLPATRCVNGGVPGYSAFQGRRLLKAVSIQELPDVVVVSFLFNDNAYWDGLSDLEQAMTMNSFGAQLVRYSRVAATMSTIWRHWAEAPDDAPKRPRLTDEEYLDELEKIAGHCREMGSRTVFLVWPLRKQVRSGFSITKQNVMRHVAARHGIPIVDLIPTFQQHGDVDLFVDVVHANVAGHRLIAECLEMMWHQGLKHSLERSYGH